MDGFKIGKAALKEFNEMYGAPDIAGQQLGCYAPFLGHSYESLNPFSISQTKRHYKLHSTLVVPQEHVRRALLSIKAGWESIFRGQGYDDSPMLSWAKVCSPILQGETGRQFVKQNLLKSIVQYESIATMHGSLMARITPSLIVAIAIMDRAEIQLSHTHQKDVVVRLNGIRMQFVITQSGPLSFVRLNIISTDETRGTLPEYSRAVAFLDEGQSWTSLEGIKSTSDLHTVLRNGGFCSADRDFLSHGFLQEQVISFMAATRYLQLAVQAYEIANLSFLTEDDSSIGGLPPKKGHRTSSWNFTHSSPMRQLTELICCEFYEKLGRPSSSNLHAQILAIRMQHWVSIILQQYDGARDPSKAHNRSQPPPFSSTDHVRTISENLDFPAADRDSITCARTGEAAAAGVQGGNGIKTNRDTSTDTASELKSKDGSPHAWHIDSRGASAWLACWSICRMLAHVQILPAFLSTHSSELSCWAL